MQEIEDERWRQAARALKLDLVGADGQVVPNERGTQGDAMRGRVDGQRVIVRYGAHHTREQTTAIDVVLRRNLLLGLQAHVYRDPAPPSNRYGVVPQAVFSGLKSIDDGRAKAFFAGSSGGRELWGYLHALASLGWVELTDSHLRVQAEVFSDSAEGWVDLIRKALRGAPEGTGGVVVGKAGVGMHITDDMNRFRHMAQAGNFRVKADRNVNVILAG